MISATSPFGFAVFRLDRFTQTVGSNATALHVVGGQEGGEGLGVRAESIPIILTFLAASSIGLPSAAFWVGEMTIAAGFSETAFSRMEICSIDIRFGLRPEFRNLHIEVFASLAGTGQDDLPIVRGRVLDNNRDGRLRVRGWEWLNHPGGGDDCQETGKNAPAGGGNRKVSWGLSHYQRPQIRGFNQVKGAA